MLSPFYNRCNVNIVKKLLLNVLSLLALPESKDFPQGGIAG